MEETVLEKTARPGNGAATQSAAARPEGAGALYGLRVIDLTQFEAGTSCTETLAWLGAEVIKVEEPGKGEQGRGASTNAGMDSFYFILLNANKRSVTANLRDERGKEILRDLIRHGDVLVENFGPGVIERMGFGWDEVQKLNPRCVMAQIKGFGPDGPYGKFLAFDMIAQAAGGSLSVTGEREGRPLRPGVNIGDTGAGIHCATGILAALFERQFTGKGQRVEVCMQDVVINFARNTYAAQLLNNGEAARRNGNQSVLAVTAPSEIYPCKGGGRNDYCYIYTSRATPTHWLRLLKVIGREELAEDPRFADPVERYNNRKEVDEVIADWTLERPKAEVMKLMGEAGVPCGAVYDTKDLSEDTYLRKRGMFQEMDHPQRGKFVIPVSPIQMSNAKNELKPSPLLGADTDDEYGNLLGLEPEKLEELRKEKVI
jgi:formyl-CoA transferase